MNARRKSIIRSWLRGSIRKHQILAGPLKGYGIVTSWRDYPSAITGRTEQPLLGWFAENVKAGETWLDVGAHYGYTAIALSRLVGVHGRVFAFEPMVSTAGYLTRTRLLNNLTQLTVTPMALACPETLASEELPTARGMADSTMKSGESHETILTTSLDWLWPLVCRSRPQIDGIKMDVQGMEVQALRGMQGLLKRYKPKLVVEIHHGVARDQLLDLITAAGYSRRGIAIEPVQGELEPQYIDDRSYAFQAAPIDRQPKDAD